MEKAVHLPMVNLKILKNDNKITLKSKVYTMHAHSDLMRFSVLATFPLMAF